MLTVIIILAVIGILAILYAISTMIIRKYKDKYQILNTSPAVLTLILAFSLLIIFGLVRLVLSIAGVIQ